MSKETTKAQAETPHSKNCGCPPCREKRTKDLPKPDMAWLKRRQDYEIQKFQRNRLQEIMSKGRKQHEVYRQPRRKSQTTEVFNRTANPSSVKEKQQV
jgi:hypothetical protein